MAGNGVLGTSPRSESIETPFPTKDVLFVYLKGDREVIQKRLQNRFGHFMSPTLLDSQLKTLEEPSEPEMYFNVNINKTVGEIVDSILQYLDHL